MKEYLKNVNFYYVLAPVLAAVWAMFASLVSLPSARADYEKARKHFVQAQPLFTQILILDPDRLEYQKQGGGGDFDYADAVHNFAQMQKIPSSGYSLRAQGERRGKGGQKMKSASMEIESVGIEKLTQFVSGLTIEWPGLQIDQLKLKNLKSGPDDWEVDIKFTYYY